MLKVLKRPTQKKCQDHFVVVLLTNLFVLMMNLLIQYFFTGENATFKFIEAILKEYEYCKKIMKKHFNKNLIMVLKI